MKKKGGFSFLVVLYLMVLTMSFNSVAAQIEVERYTTANESYVREVNPLRGVFFSAADLKLTNLNGKIGVIAHGYMNVPVDEVYMTIYLDRLEESNGVTHWSQVDYYDFEFFAKDYPNGLTLATKDFTIINQPKNHTYRLRGQFAAFLDGAMEAFGPATDGVFIE